MFQSETKITVNRRQILSIIQYGSIFCLRNRKTDTWLKGTVLTAYLIQTDRQAVCAAKCRFSV
jgi:hypothetical protein